MDELIGLFTGWGGLLSPVLGSPWFVFVSMGVGFVVGLFVGRRSRGHIAALTARVEELEAMTGTLQIDLGDREDQLMGQIIELRAILSASERAREEAEAERDRLREKNKVLHRRCQRAEKGVAEKIVEPHHGSFGRGLANAAASMFRARAEEAEARLRAVKRAAESVRRVLGAQGDDMWTLDELDHAISGDLPPCPECAKANAKLAAVGESIGEAATMAANTGPLALKFALETIRDRILASDPEVIAVVDGWYKGNRDNPFLIDRHSHQEYFPLSTVPGKGTPVTVTVTRKGAGE